MHVFQYTSPSASHLNSPRRYVSISVSSKEILLPCKLGILRPLMTPFPVRISSVICTRVIRPSSRLVFAPYWCIIAVTWSLSRYSLACKNISVALSSALLSVFCVLATEVSALVSASEDSDESSCCLPFFQVLLGALPPTRRAALPLFLVVLSTTIAYFPP